MNESHSPRDEGTWHSEIMRAGVAGLHGIDCWDFDDHQDCRDIVFAVLTGLADDGYRLVKSDG